jgi:hypothetical protein
LRNKFSEHQKQKAQDQHDLLIASFKASTDSANEANSRGGAGIRMFVALVVIFVAFGGLLMVALIERDIPVTQFMDKEPWFDFLGFRFGGGTVAISATGFVIPDYMRFSVISIIHFLFGMAATKR